MLISTMGLLSKAFMRTAGKSLTVEGMETLTAALREPSAVNKGKGRAVDELPRRRGIVTSAYTWVGEVSSDDNL